MRVLAAAHAIRSAPWRGYLLAVSLSIIAVWLRLKLGEPMEGSPFLVSMAAILITVFLGGLRPALLAAALSALLCQFYFIPPQESLAIEWPDGWIAMAFFWMTAGLIIALVHGMFRAYEQQLRSDASLRELNEQLETRIAERSLALQEEMKERSEVQGQLRQLQKMESLGQLTGGIAHDFNNMLAIIIGSLDMAKRRLTGQEDPRLANHLDHASQGAQRAATLTARLLAYSRQQPLAPQVIDANRLLGGMSELLRRSLGEQVRLETVLAGGLWQALADPAQLENAVVNLAVNARDAMPDGGRLTIESANAELDFRYARLHPEVEEGQYVAICVTDTGTGMTPEVIERAFDPFYTTKGVGKGTGLGLSQVYGFVKQSGGHVKIYSEPGQGTTVKLYLPRHLAAPVLELEMGMQENFPPGSREQVILVVEDESAVRQMTVEALRDLGYTVLHAGDAREALQVLATHPGVDLLFTDIVMPEVTGRMLADEARALYPDLKVLFTTGYTRNAVVHNGVLDAGVAFLPKPFTLENLSLKVRAVLAGEGANRR